MRNFLLLVLGVILLAACQVPEPTARIDQTSYIPLEVGLTWEYKVTKWKYFYGQTDTSKATYTERVMITGKDTNLEGATVYYFEVKDDSLGIWRNIDPWTVWIKSFKETIVQEGNTKYLRLVFPFTEETTWNLNLYNTASNKSDPDICSIRYLGEDKKVIKVTDSDGGFPIPDRRYSVYKAGVGLVERYSYQELWPYDKYTGEIYLARLYGQKRELIQ